MGLKIGAQVVGGLKIGGEVVGGLKIGTEVVSFAPPTPPAGGTLTHTFIFTTGGSGSVGYNAPAGAGVVQGNSDDYTGNGKSLTIIHCRNVGAELNFALQGAAQDAADFPVRIVASKSTGGAATVEMTPQAGSLRPISGGRYIRQDYDPTSGAVTDVFTQAGITVTVQLYY